MNNEWVARLLVTEALIGVSCKDRATVNLLTNLLMKKISANDIYITFLPTASFPPPVLCHVICEQSDVCVSVCFLSLQVSLINFVASLLGAGGIQAFKTMRTLRALRPLRAMSRMQGMRVRLYPLPLESLES